MKVYAFVKIQHHPQEPDGQGSHYGDVVSFHRIDREFSKDELKYFLPVPMDLKVPCGDEFMKPGSKTYGCKDCKDNDPELCEVAKYERGEWSEGTVFDPPQVVKSRRYTVDLKAIVPSETLAMAENKTKDALTEAAIMDTMGKITTQTVSVIKDKV